MITIHEQNTTEFSNLGIGVLMPISCVITEELNGMYELEMEHPYDSFGKWEYIENKRIIYAKNQPFRIYKTNPTMDSITVSARHIFYDLLDNYISSRTLTSSLTLFKYYFNYTMPFSFYSEMDVEGSVALEQTNPVTALLGDEGYINTFGGEIERDSFNVNIKPTIGSDKGVCISYRKNLLGLEIEEDISEVVTRIITEDDEEIDSDYINDYPYPKILYTDEITDFTSGIDLPTVNIVVDFQLLSKTEEYKNFAVLEDVALGDVVTVSNTKMKFSKKAQVISYEWDCILEKYNMVELGDFVSDITDSISSGKSSYDVAASASTTAKQIYSLISGNITIKDNYLYVAIDNTDYTQATKVFRFGVNGLQFSSNSMTTWNSIISADGEVV